MFDDLVPGSASPSSGPRSSKFLANEGNVTRGAGERIAQHYSVSKDAVIVTLNAGANARAAYHESFHRLQRLFLNEDERGLLAEETETLRSFVVSVQGNAEKARRMTAVEVEAEAFAIYVEHMDRDGKAPLRVKGRIRAAWNRIADATAQVVDHINGRDETSLADAVDVILAEVLPGEGAGKQPAEKISQSGDGSRKSPVEVKNSEDLGSVILRVGTPTAAQAKAGNYAKVHARWQGLDIAIETPKGGKRSGVDRGGKAWEVTMPAHYGDFKGTKGADGDPVDVYVGDDPASPRVFVVDQKDADTGKFDEVKVFVGVPDKATVRRIYKGAFSDGRATDRLQAITETTVDELKTWLASSRSQKAFGTPLA